MKVNKQPPVGSFSDLPSKIRNVLEINRIIRIRDLVELYKREGNFLSLRRCGPATNAVLMEFLNRKKYLVTDSDSGTETGLGLSVNGRPAEGYELSEYENLFLELSDRARNTLLRNGIMNIDQMVEYYRNNDGFTDLRHCGEKTDEELAMLCSELLERQ